MAGGARVGAGRPPDPNALRRDRKDDASWTRLPAEGRQGDLPAWPLPDQSEREAHLWSEFWSKPQAILWERNGQTYEVAMYVRTFAEAEQSGAVVTLRTLARQQADALLLTIPAMRQARVAIAGDEVNSRRTAKSKAPRQTSPRDRLKAVPGGGA
jgi:hypothetical protein